MTQVLLLVEPPIDFCFDQPFLAGLIFPANDVTSVHCGRTPLYEIQERPTNSSVSNKISDHRAMRIGFLPISSTADGCFCQMEEELSFLMS